MKIRFKTVDDDDGYELGVALWPCVPRKGEHVVLDGLVTKEEWGESDGGTDPDALHQHEVCFEVVDVIYRGDMNARFKDESDPDVEVWLALPFEERSWEGAVRR